MVGVEVKFARGCKSDEKDVRDDVCDEFFTEVCYSDGKTKVSSTTKYTGDLC